MRRVALFVPNWVGDVVMATPAIRAIRERFSHAQLVGFGRAYVADVLSGNPWFDEFRVLPRKWSKSLRELLRSRDRFDVGILFPNSVRVALMAKLVGCKRLIGYDRGDRGWLLDRRLYHPRTDGGRFRPTPLLLAYNRLAETVGAKVRSLSMQLFITDTEDAAADHAWRVFGIQPGEPVVLLHPGGAFGPAKHWPVAHFVTLARQLIDEFAVRIVVLCGPSEIGLAAQIVEGTRRLGIHSLGEIGPSLGLSKACVRRGRLLVTTDSGPRHFAAALGIPCLSLFGPTHIEWTRTFTPTEMCLQLTVPCGPCQQKSCKTDHRCMTDLHPEMVIRAAVRLLRDQRCCVS
jgi:heptosyltransferase-2